MRADRESSVENGRLSMTFDWRTHPGWRGGTWLQEEDRSPETPPS
jgi:hypothetical protein